MSKLARATRHGHAASAPLRRSAQAGISRFLVSITGEPAAATITNAREMRPGGRYIKARAQVWGVEPVSKLARATRHGHAAQT